MLSYIIDYMDIIENLKTMQHGANFEQVACIEGYIHTVEILGPRYNELLVTYYLNGDDTYLKPIYYRLMDIDQNTGLWCLGLKVTEPYLPPMGTPYQ